MTHNKARPGRAVSSFLGVLCKILFWTTRGSSNTLVMHQLARHWEKKQLILRIFEPRNWNVEKMTRKGTQWGTSMPINSIDGEFSSVMFILNLGNKYQDCNSLKDTEGHYSMWSIMFILKYVCIRCAQHCILLRLCFPLKTDMWLSIDVTRCTTTQATMPLSWQLSFVYSTVFSHPSFIFILLPFCLSF